MTKNIILCADGTGNKGGYTPDSNVYKMYNAIEIHDSKIPQYTFYDNGVGTSTNKYWRAITGAVGLGVRNNIKDLYRFLATHYEMDDPVYLFGFSRGGATIRAFCGFIKAVGLVNGRHLSDQQLKDYTDDAFAAYQCHRKNPDRAQAFREHHHSHGVIDIHFVGVWDTVSALGFPKNTEARGLTLRLISPLFSALEKISNYFWPHLFYNYELSKNIKFACQALAIDDERTAFQPRVWDEVKAKRKLDNVEQVWFAGMHANVGGGYERQGMANVTLHWMMLRANNHGLQFKPGIQDKIYQDSNIHGRLYNSRDGLAVYYRYHPRNIHQLCAGRLLTNIKLHCSTLERLRKRTANYTPMVLPAKFDVVLSKPGTELMSVDVTGSDEHKLQQQIIDEAINTRKGLYGRLADITLFLLIYILYFSIINKDDNVSLLSLLINSLTKGDVIELTKNLYEYHLHAIVIVIAVGYLVNKKRKSTIQKMTIASEKIRKIFVDAFSQSG